MTLLDVKLKVPASLADCAKWISQQEPSVVAEALSLAEISFNAVRREISETEASRLLKLHKQEVQALHQQLQLERDKTQKVAEELQESFEASLVADRSRHNASIEAMQRQLQVAADAHKTTQKLLAEERQELLASRDEEIQGLKRRLSSESSAAEARHSKEVAALREQLHVLSENASSSLKAELQTLRETYEKRIACTQEENKRVVESLTQRVQELVREVTEARSAQHAMLEESERMLRERLEEDFSRQRELMKSEISSLSAELKRKEGCEALARQQENARHEHSSQQLRDQIRSLEQLRSEDLATHTTALRELQADHEQKLRDREDWLKQEMSKKDELLSRRDEALALAAESQRAVSLDYSNRLEALLAEQRELVKNLTGSSAAVGKVGETLVSTVFARLELGSWQDDSKNPAEGFADALWTWTPPNCAPLAAMIDVKLVTQLHSQHDIAKFYKDLSTAVACDRANAGMLISLNARCPNTRPLHISLYQGVPVCIVSRAADDALSAAAMVELGFLAMAQAWPLICRQRGSNSEQTILAAGQHLDAQLQDFEKVVKKIMSMAGCATRMAREAESMKKLVNDMVRGIDVLRQSHPQLTPNAEEVIEEDSSPAEEDEEDWESEGLLGLACTICLRQRCTLIWEESRTPAILKTMSSSSMKYKA